MSITTREDLLAMTPEVYLAQGYLTADGTPRPILTGQAASAAATQLLAAEVSPQELGFTVDAIRLLLEPQQDDPIRERVRAALEETVSLVARTIRQPNNAGLWRWLSACAAPVTSAAELGAFLTHLQAVYRLYTLLVATQPAQGAA